MHTVNQLTLLVQPAFRDVVPPLEHDVVALQTAGEVVPGARYEGVFFFEVLDDGLERSLFQEVSPEYNHRIRVSRYEFGYMVYNTVFNRGDAV
jgi:hypothetical protein